MAQTDKYIISNELKRRLLDKDYCKKYVDSLLKAAESGNVTAIQEVNNRVEGKVKDVIDLSTSIKGLQPNQEETEALDAKFSINKGKVIDIQPTNDKADDIKTLPEPFNAEQIEDYPINPRIDTLNKIDHINRIDTNNPVIEKTDTFPGDCQAFTADGFPKLPGIDETTQTYPKPKYFHDHKE
jgi:hypothetical protein